MFACPNCKTDVAPSLDACPACGAVITDFLRRHNAEPLDGKYQILAVLGIGGMGEVYKALHVHLHALRVIKLMRANIAGDRDAHDRFLREARLATRIQHPNVAILFDFSALPDGSFYMVWEYIEGTDLRKFVLERQFLRPAAAVRLAVQALMGLEAIHRAGIVHRDVSPDNLMVTRDEHGLERIKIIDLGIAKQWDDSGDEQTKTGMFIGKFKYCSPEQLGMLEKGERIDGRADIYSFALVLYEMLTGVAPFEAETPHQYLVLHSSQMPPPLRKANPQSIVPAQLEAIIFKALAKDRERRFNTAAEFAKALDDALLAIPEQIEYPSTVVAALPQAQSVATPMTNVGRVLNPSVLNPSTGTTTRTRDLYGSVVRAIGEEQYAKGDASLQTLKMHLGVKAETDGDYRRLRKELDLAAKEKEASYVAAIERAKQSGKPKEVQRLLAEREERLGRRFGDPSLKLETDIWLRRRDELLAKARTWMTAESFANAGRVLDELAEHLEDGANADDEFVALRQSFQHGVIESSEKMRQEIAAAHAQENIAKTRRLLSMYNARFGRERRKHSSIEAAETWMREMDALRKTGERKEETTAVHRLRRRRAGVVAWLVVLAILAGGGAAAWHWKDQTLDLWRRITALTSSRRP